ncbi:hypothetical protein [Myceligenerans salitolerans]|uniref:Uncharacterized protein n=1 Tax=Myceligenerans salitolerans TaxID=1230528 RepID=A0ABS3I7F1_9MICO|nr:hypothetical protein [Myceligenerans salitolerans]MBO0608888.1 hypothetical protein [Myceligenerans salitolerans]
MRLSRRETRQVGDLHEQLRVAATGLHLAGARPTIRVHPTGSKSVQRLRDGLRLDVCELWAVIGHNPNPRRVCGLSAGMQLRTDSIEQAVQNAGFILPPPGQAPRSRWRPTPPPLDSDVPGPWFDLELAIPNTTRARHAASTWPAGRALQSA